MTYIVLLRGINVGGKRKILMKDLKSLLENNSYKNVITYIQSGNIILNSPETNGDKIKIDITTLIKSTFGFDVPVMVLNPERFNTIYTLNPFLDHDISSLHVTILENPQSDIELNPEEAKQVDNHIYLFCPNGYSKTKYTNDFFEKKLKSKATTRNWKTIAKLMELSTTV